MEWSPSQLLSFNQPPPFGHESDLDSEQSQSAWGWPAVLWVKAPIQMVARADDDGEIDEVDVSDVEHDLREAEKIIKKKEINRYRYQYQQQNTIGCFTYVQLVQATLELTVRLRRDGCSNGTRVGLLCDNGPGIIVAELAIMWAGGIFVPLPRPGSVPLDFVTTVVRDSRATMLVCDAMQRQTVEEIACAIKIPVVALPNYSDSDCISKNRHDSNSIEQRLMAPRDTCCIFHTSGTTGKPKPVASSFESLALFSSGMSEVYGLDRRSRLFVGTNNIFDPSVGDIFAALRIGATVCIAPWEATLHNLGACIALTNATHVGSTPAVWSLATCSLEENVRLESLKIVALGGERIPVPLARTWLRRGAVLINLYGITEAMGYQCAHQVPGDSRDPLSVANEWSNAVLDQEIRCIGSPLSSIRLGISNCSSYSDSSGSDGPISNGGNITHDMVELSVDDVGHVSANQKEKLIARGALYVKRDHGIAYQGHGKTPVSTDWITTGDSVELVGPAQNLNDKTRRLYVIGRLDNTLKIGGRRISQEDIEAAVTSCTLVEACITCKEDAKSLICGIWRRQPNIHSQDNKVSHCTNQSLIAAVRCDLQRRYPQYLIPSRIMVIDSHLPITLSGKFNRKSASTLLQSTIEINATSTVSIEPRRALNPIEATVAQAWKWALSINDIEIDASTSLFDIGGDSLSALRVSLYLQKYFLGQQPDLRTFSGRVGDIAGVFAPICLLSRPVLHDYALYIEEVLDKSKLKAAMLNDVATESGESQPKIKLSANTTVLRAFFDAVKCNDIEVVTSLLDCNSDPDGEINRQNPGLSPLHIAARGDNFELAQLFISRGASMTAVTGTRLAPGHLAAKFSPRVLKLLIEAGCPIGVTDSNKQNMLHMAARNGSLESINILCNRIKINATDRWHRTPLHWAIINGHHSAVKALIQMSADVNFQIRESAHRRRTTLKQQPPLHNAARMVHFHNAHKSVCALLEAGADVNLLDSDGQTALHHVCYSTPKSDTTSGGDCGANIRIIVRLLIEHGACIDIRDSNSETPLEVAQALYNVEAEQEIRRLSWKALPEHRPQS